MATPPTRSAIKFDLFADQARKRKLQALGDPLEVISHHIDFAHLAGLIDELLPCKDTSKGGRPPYPTEVMVRILVLKHLHNLNDEQLEFQLLDRMNHQRFCPLVDSQLLRHGYLARCGQIIDATLVSAPIQHFTKNERAQFDAGQIPQDWSAAKRRQKDLDATHTKKHGKRYHGYKLSISVDVRHKFIRKIETGTASEHDSTHFDDVLDQGNTGADVYADKGYPSKDRTQMLRALGFRERIQRKARLGKPLSACQKGAQPAHRQDQGTRGAPLCSDAAHGRQDHPHHWADSRHGGLTMKAACYNLERLARFLQDGVDAFYKTKRSGAKLRPQGA